MFIIQFCISYSITVTDTLSTMNSHVVWKQCGYSLRPDPESFDRGVLSLKNSDVFIPHLFHILQEFQLIIPSESKI